MLETSARDTDDPEFIDKVNCFLRGIGKVHQPKEIHVFYIDNWFDHKWLDFSGKAMGAFGVWKTDTTLPPFSPNRVLGQGHFVLGSDQDYEYQGAGKALHVWTPASNGLNRKLKALAPNAALFWYSGGTRTNDHGSLMAYIPIEDELITWYTSFIKRDAWCLGESKQISKSELDFLEQQGKTVG